MKVAVGISNRHVHLTKEDFELLFGKRELTKRNDLKQPGQFACNERVTIEGCKGSIENMIIVGPFRNYTQVEISKTDCYKLGIEAPVRDSGDLEGASMVTIIGPLGKLEKPCAIIANRHIHVDKEILKEKNLVGIKEVRIKITGEKSGILENVHIKEMDDAYFELHLDTDDANAFLLKNGYEVEILDK